MMDGVLWLLYLYLRGISVIHFGYCVSGEMYLYCISIHAHGPYWLIVLMHVCLC